MKANNTLLLIFSIMAVLVGYTFFTFTSNNFKLLYAIFGGLATWVYFLFLFVLKNEDERKTINYKSLSTVFLLIHFIVMLIFLSPDRKLETFVIIILFKLLSYFGIVYRLLQKQHNSY
jgi:hypothetical protein